MKLRPVALMAIWLLIGLFVDRFIRYNTHYGSRFIFRFLLLIRLYKNLGF
jgi:hypothetical protein